LGLSVSGPFVCRCLTSLALLRFHSPPHQTGRADFPHPAFGQTSPRRPRGGHFSFPLRDGYSRPLERLGITEVARPKANRSPVILSSGNARTKAPSLDPRYRASSLLRASPPPRTTEPAPRGGLVERHARSSPGLPVLRTNSSFVHADVNTPAERMGAYVVRLPNHNGLPRFDFGSASATPFRGVLNVHSRFGLYAR
jgi:hypothetical protein